MDENRLTLQNNKLSEKHGSTHNTLILPKHSQLASPLPGPVIGGASGPGEVSPSETDPARTTATYPPDNFDMEPSSITSFVASHVWKFAKTQPTNPHWYVVKEKCRSAEEFERMVIHIRKFGYKEKFKGHYYTVFQWQVPKELGPPLPWSEPAKMWSMGWPVNQTIIINAKPLSYDKP